MVMLPAHHSIRGGERPRDSMGVVLWQKEELWPRKGVEWRTVEGLEAGRGRRWLKRAGTE